MLRERDPNLKRSIRCKIITSKNVPAAKELETKDIVFYVHGGAFIACSPESHESFLSDLARQLGPKVAFLVVDYRLAPEARFPAGLQDVLDSYLWLRNSTEEAIEKVLGFKIGKVIIAGESAGPCLIGGMVCSLADGKKKWPEKDLPLPGGIFSMVGLFTMQIESHPSSLLNALTTSFSPYQKALIFIGAYSPFQPELEEYRSGKDFLESPAFQKYLELVKQPYFSPLSYDDFESLKEVPLSMVTSTACFVAEDSVLMAAKWRGAVNLIALQKQPHAFGIFAANAESCRKGLQVCGNEIKRLLD